MNTIKRILIPVDFSSSATTAVNYALGMTKRDRKLEFTLIHAQNPETSTEVTKEDLSNLQELFTQEDVKCDVWFETGELVNTLINAVEKLKIDLIVMGTAGSPGDYINSNTIDLLKSADCPVLVVPKTSNGFELNEIALALDESGFDDASDLGLLHDLARWYNAKVHLLTIDQNLGSGNIKLGEQENTLEYYLDNLDYRYSFPKNTDIEKGIKKYVNEKNIDILAILPRHHAKKTQPSDGRLTQLLAAHSSVPVLVLD